MDLCTIDAETARDVALDQTLRDLQDNLTELLQSQRCCARTSPPVTIVSTAGGRTQVELVMMLDPVPEMPQLRLVLCLADDLASPQSGIEGSTTNGQAASPPRGDGIGDVATPVGEGDLIPYEMRLSYQLGSKILQQLAKARSPDATFSLKVRASRCEQRDNFSFLQFASGDRQVGSAEFEVVSVDFDDYASYFNQEKQCQPKYRLTQRETEVLTWVGRGKTSSEIAMILGVSTRTVDFHCAQAMGRLDVMNRTQAVALAVASGLITT